jgi:hypothetical protein
MKASLIAYWAAKEGSSAAEYEDAWRALPGPADEVPGNWVAIAVADGATESLLARQWAALTADEFALARTAVCDAGSFADTALALSARWPAVVESYTVKREEAGRPLRWYERPGLEKGAFATLLTLQMNVDDAPADDPEPLAQAGIPRVIGDWRSAAIGDTCLFHIRDGRLQAAFPLDRSGSFNTSPALLGSYDADPEVIAHHVRFAEGTVAEGDDFFVCTDAMAAWFIACVEEGGRPWETLRDLTEIGFAEWVSEARWAGGLHNDDVTLVHMDIW